VHKRPNTPSLTHITIPTHKASSTITIRHTQPCPSSSTPPCSSRLPDLDRHLVPLLSNQGLVWVQCNPRPTPTARVCTRNQGTTIISNTITPNTRRNIRMALALAKAALVQRIMGSHCMVLARAACKALWVWVDKVVVLVDLIRMQADPGQQHLLKLLINRMPRRTLVVWEQDAEVSSRHKSKVNLKVRAKDMVDKVLKAKVSMVVLGLVEMLVVQAA